jgi:hypothetical protein
MQTAPPKDPYVKVEGAPSAQQESIPAPTLVATAYGLIWLLVAGFVFTVWRRNQALKQDLDDLTRKLETVEAGRKR